MHGCDFSDLGPLDLFITAIADAAFKFSKLFCIVASSIAVETDFTVEVLSWYF